MKGLICLSVMAAAVLVAACSTDSLTKVDEKIGSEQVQNTIDVT